MNTWRGPQPQIDPIADSSFAVFLVVDGYNLKGSEARFDGSAIPHGKVQFPRIIK